MYNSLMFWIYDSLLDNLWVGLVEPQYVKIAGTLAFNLAFNNDLTSDEQATLASKLKFSLNFKRTSK